MVSGNITDSKTEVLFDGHECSAIKIWQETGLDMHTMKSVLQVDLVGMTEHSGLDQRGASMAPKQAWILILQKNRGGYLSEQEHHP